MTNDGLAKAAAVTLKDMLNTRHVNYISVTGTLGSCSYSKVSGG